MWIRSLYKVCWSTGEFYRVFSCRLSTAKSQNERKLVVITGCDSGLGYSISLKCKELGYAVVSGCLHMDSEGAKALSMRNHTHKLDVTKTKSVRDFHEHVSNIIKSENYELHAVVNNAGIMMFGEFEWLTERQISEHIDVNMMGSFRIAKAFLPLLRKYEGRLINISSHCSIANLPCLSVYGATKAAIQSWSDGLRVEQAKYGVKVITFLPGSLATQSNIMDRQASHAAEMESEFSKEQQCFYGEYFKRFMSYLTGIPKESRVLQPIIDEVLYKKFTEALESPNPKYMYKHEPIRYFIYYNLFKYAPVFIRDYFVEVFVKFPSYKNK